MMKKQSPIPNAHFLLDPAIVDQKYDSLLELGAMICYSVKANYELIPFLEEKPSCYFHMHTFDDCDHVTDPSKIWFLLQASQQEDIGKLLDRGVSKFIVDNENDLQRLLDASSDHTIDLLLRTKMKERTTETGRYYVFGMDPSVVSRLIDELQGDKRISRLGIHFHRKTQNIAEWNIANDLQFTFDEQTLRKCDYVDVGGGLPAGYKNSSDSRLPAIFEKLKTTVDWLRTLDVEMIIEPGRFLAAYPVSLCTYVQDVCGRTITVNASVYNSAMDSILVKPTRLLVAGELASGNSFIVKGCTPDSLDVFRYEVFFDGTPERGDAIIFAHAGAYNYATDYYQLPKLKTIVKKRGDE